MSNQEKKELLDVFKKGPWKTLVFLFINNIGSRYIQTMGAGWSRRKRYCHEFWRCSR
jgi:hypothetical protein